MRLKLTYDLVGEQECRLFFFPEDEAIFLHWFHLYRVGLSSCEEKDNYDERVGHPLSKPLPDLKQINK